jgi:hypothetical protein
MRDITIQEFEGCLWSTLSGNRCVQQWLGLGDCLFLGFGRDVIPPPLRGTGGPIAPETDPPHQLVTHLSDWTIRDRWGLVGSSHDDPMAEAAADYLVGRSVTSWELDRRTCGLVVAFEEGLQLHVEPYEQIDASLTGDLLWRVRGPDGVCAFITKSRRTFVLHRSEPLPCI